MDNSNQKKYVETTYQSQVQKKQLSFPFQQQGNSPITTYTSTYVQPITTYQQAQPYTYITTQTIPVIEKIIKEKDTGLEDKVALLTTELQRLQSQLAMKNQELQEMTNKYHQLYQTIDQKQNSDTRIQGILNENKKIREEIETWKKSYMQFEENYQHLDKLRKEEERQKLTFSAENEKLKLEINQLKDKLYHLETHTSQLKFQFNQETVTKISELEQTILIKTRQTEEYQKQISSLELQLKDNSKSQVMQNRFVLIAAENERIHQILRQVLQENDHEREKSALLEQKIQVYEQQMSDIKKFENKIVLLQTEIQRLQSELNTKNQLFESKQNEYNTSIYMKEQIITELQNSQYQVDYKTNLKVTELENKIVTLTTELERLQELRIQQENNCQHYKIGWISNPEKMNKNGAFKLKKRIPRFFNLKKNYLRLSLNLKELKVYPMKNPRNQPMPNYSFQLKFKLTKFSLQNYNGKIQEITSSHSRIEKSNSELLNQITIYQQKNQALEATILDYEEKIAKLSTELERQQGFRYSLEVSQKESIEKIGFENKKLQEKIMIYEQKCTHLSNEIIRLQQSISAFSDENSQLQTKIATLSQELIKLENLLNTSQTELTKFKNYTSSQQQTIYDLEESQKQLKQLADHSSSKLTMQEQTITTITTTITERESQIQMLQEQLSLLLNEFKSLESEHQATANYLSKYQEKQMSFDLSSTKNKKFLANFVLICVEVESLRFRINQLLDDNAQVRKSLVKQAEIVKQSQFIPRQSSTQVYETVKFSKQSQF